MIHVVQHDPHSPHMSERGSWGEGLWATLRGAFHAHMGWLFAGHSKGLGKYSADLKADRALVLANGHFVAWVFFGLLFPAVLGGLLTMSWTGVLLGFLWGGLVRVLLVHHITWSVNSVCHFLGKRRFDTNDRSTNVFWLALPSLGESWHHNHHAFPRSAVHGLKRWEMDPSGLIIAAMEKIGLARNVVRISPERQAERAT